jgi:hypothetical protein
MIQQLILSTIFACAKKNNVPPTDDNPSPLPTQNQETEEQESTQNGEQKTKPEPIGPTIVPPTILSENGQQNFKGAIRVAHILNIQKSNQEISCALLCQQSINDNPIIQNKNNMIAFCTETRQEDWDELIAQGEESMVVGTVECDLRSAPRIIKGRAPLNMNEDFIPATSLATHFARQAQEEALSVFSFAELYNALQRLQAPPTLLDRCLEALIDEQNHTKLAITLCIKHGGSTPCITVPKSSTPDLFTITMHNALVGCIQESWAALIEQYQAEHTKFHNHIQNRIAKDETKHAQLAWDVHEFLIKKLPLQEQVTVTETMRTLLDKQKVDWIRPFPSSAEIGIPSQAIQKDLYNEFSKNLQNILTVAA